MVFVSSAVLGAAAGTGLALLVAVTIVMYRYYVVRRKGKEWAELDRLEEKKAARKINLQDCNVTSGSVPIQPASSVVHHSISSETLGTGAVEVTPSPLQPTLSATGSTKKSYGTSDTRTGPGCRPAHAAASTASRNNSMESVHSRSSSYRESVPKFMTHANSDTRSTTSDNLILRKSRSPSPMRTFSLEGRFPIGGPSNHSAAAVLADGTERGSKASLASVVSGGSPRDFSSPKKRNSTFSGVVSLAGDGNVPDSPIGSIRSDSSRSPRRRVPVILAANDIHSVLGRFHLRLKYDGSKEELLVHLVEAQDLTPAGDTGFRDPYVKMYLEPDEEQRTQQTAVHRTETHPYFDQQLSFPLKPRNLVKSNFVLQLLDYDRFSHDEVVGEIRFLLNTLDLSGCELWGDLIAVRKPSETTAELLISLSYLPQAERLTVVVMKAKNLSISHEPFVKLYLLVNDKRTKKRKTSAIRALDPTNPIWNEAFTFELPSSQLQDAGVELFVTSNEAEGQDLGCGVGLREGGSGTQHWQDLMQNNRKPIAMWHVLR
ncbi:synaptotagmin-7 isoform X1 [Anopheles arabiensis]|uniref:C2 domain-containing protein n=2 Tax=gambiae species complex TaxID=44542 RepID=A0A6E8WA17_ANOCL|nr:synaptotagmin-7 isoform X1 [Anopheles arabiensis]XP_040168016.1 synaptotagmin-7 isoform X1 [Anopheles arabiensis]XP_040168017.1 synaptotagmin-7 isoform X1 [Anopheles arabiensis]XP_040168018.1 synaptotagmin-7 isoform X1 [Anopheles arabiensis]XP_040168019.1 synaptotagmin-7 isoform X1 [Anopheles arabiensis]XP_040236815.1 synaptotagmin-7 isoform X1 [Anopheles coluzzii]XP_040236816.1 synaptotagmin-7 isoform X1 [Anopheles coluzzii]XP_040236817.1 synaptotagmin-7 isoform X1 [Anopheles coluzzii]X